VKIILNLKGIRVTKARNMWMAGTWVTCFASGMVFADPAKTSDRPGRVDAPDNSPDATTIQPAPDATDRIDNDFLRQTAKQMDVSAPGDHPDREFLNWYGLRTKLIDAGIDFHGNLTLDYSKPLMGGVDTRGSDFRHLLDLRFTLDTQALLGLGGGTFSIDFQNQHGHDGSDRVGDLQGINNADADGRTQISELWYEQKLFDDFLRVKLGKVDGNTEFGFPACAAGFLNPSFGYSPTVVGLPTYPDPATSLNVFVYPAKWLYAGFGVYDGSGAAGVHTGSVGPGKLFDGDGLFYIVQLGLRWVLADDTLPGHFAVGSHYHDGLFPRFNGTNQRGAAGAYALFEQKIWHKRYYDKTNADGLYFFAQFGHGDEDVSPVSAHFSAGLTWVGPYEKANPDSLGIAFTSVETSDEPGAGFTRNYETAIEAYYQWQVTEYLSIKPDLQYIINPGGDRNLDNALVATLRVVFAF
jgi:porin